ncbi:ABC transporter substrate-binding protein [Weissella ceti]|uniref:ABC transporter substrate-binding protein n=1 Tax=Weissella ceti TaxID=759620 RepID=A0ABT3E276_9LACO|nr:ABC transporter substrate-binding protein [Weissella ceti]MCW0952520.1 ABC transporter substrate-binding protein [Weissella ceti]QVK11813.1 ABC transporter substrate-binding protein [Weissella ceti]
MTKTQLRLMAGCVLVLVLLAGGWLWLAFAQMTPGNSDQAFKRVVTTTNAQSEVFDQLGIEQVVGVATPGTNKQVPTRYAELPQVGNHVSPNMEKIGSLKPDAVYVDAALIDDYKKRLTSDGIKVEVLNFKTVANLQDSITKLGDTFGKEQEAVKLNRTLDLKDRKMTKHPKVLLLMGMPGGSFLAGTKYSYVGDLVERAGGEIMTTSDAKSDYVQPNMEQLVHEQPDVIITMAHAMEDSVFASFKETLQSANWQQMRAVKNKHVYQAKEPIFGMTANLNAPQAFKQIQDWLAEVKSK